MLPVFGDCCGIIYTKCFTSDLTYGKCALVSISQSACGSEKQRKQWAPSSVGEEKKNDNFVQHFMSSTLFSHRRGLVRCKSQCYCFRPKPGVQQEWCSCFQFSNTIVFHWGNFVSPQGIFDIWRQLGMILAFSEQRPGRLLTLYCMMFFPSNP